MTRLRSRPGMSLAEMLVALAIFGTVMAVSLKFLSTQSDAVRLGNTRLGAVQNAQFAINTLDEQLRTMGAGTLDKQPFLIYAGPDVVAFNANYATNVANDPFAVYYDPDAPTGTVTALRATQQITLPNTAFAYPSVDYLDEAGTNSPAETIIFFFQPDTSTPRADDYVLYRQVNQDPPAVVARNILATPNQPFFEYYRLFSPPSAAAYVDSVPSNLIPLSHSVPVHLSPADTGTESIIDSVRAVRVTLTVTDGNTGAAEHRRTISRLIDLPNAGLATRQTCGDPPIFGSAVTATEHTDSTGVESVNLSWNAAVDETGGEKDVVRYVIYRKLAAAVDWGDPYLSIPAGNATYIYNDAAVTHGTTYLYAVAAQDCTPSLSSLAASAPVLVP